MGTSNSLLFFQAFWLQLQCSDLHVLAKNCHSCPRDLLSYTFYSWGKAFMHSILKLRQTVLVPLGIPMGLDCFLGVHMLQRLRSLHRVLTS